MNHLDTYMVTVGWLSFMAFSLLWAVWPRGPRRNTRAGRFERWVNRLGR